MTLPSDIDPYVALGVSRDATIAEIRAAYRTRVLKCHPSRVQDESQRIVAQDEFQQVQQAYETLCARYDRKAKLAEPKRELLEARRRTAESSQYSPPRGDRSGAARGAEEGRVSADGKKKARTPASSSDGAAKELRKTTKTKLADRAKQRDWERRQQAAARFDRNYVALAESDSGSDSTDSEIYVRFKRPTYRSRESLESREPQESREPRSRPTKSARRRGRSYNDGDDDYSSWQGLAEEHIQRVMKDSSRVSRSPQRHNGYQSADPNMSASRQMPSHTIFESEGFSKFVRSLFEEIKRDQHAASSFLEGIDPSKSIEELIKERNKDVKAGPPPRPPHTSPLNSRPEPAGESSSNNPPKTEKLYSVPPEQLNLQVMYSKHTVELVDIVAVHGLGAIPDITWTEKKSGINWLSDETMLPNAVPEARILRFGYDSLWIGDTPIRTTLSTISTKLLICLNTIRTEDLERPLLFIGHCFGGLVIERALILAKMQQNKYPGIFNSTIGVVFLGTPHRGSNSFTEESALLTAIAASSDLYKNRETDVLRSMTSSNGTLLDVADDFITLCVQGGPQVSCFFEQRSSKLGKVIGRDDIKEFIVDSKSASFDGHPKYGLEVDHFSLNKFDGPKNPSYIQVQSVIADYYEQALKSARNSHSSRGQRQSLMERQEEDLRKEAIKKLHEEESQKQASSWEVEYRKRLAEEKRATEQAYVERVKKNMRKYGIEKPEIILAEHPLPRDDELKSTQEIKEKSRWHRNLLKGALSQHGLGHGQIDEILNDMGETITIDGIEITITKMSKKWVSTRTLDAYDIPWQYDKHDRSIIIVKRWVPDYEREFLWDHSYALRGGRGRRRNHDCGQAKNGDKSEGSEEQLKAWLIRKWERFNATQMKTQNWPSSPSRSNAIVEPPIASNVDNHQRASVRSASAESIRSAPEPEEVTRRRRNSRTLSREGSTTSPPSTKTGRYRLGYSTGDEGVPSPGRRQRSKSISLFSRHDVRYAPAPY